MTLGIMQEELPRAPGGVVSCVKGRIDGYVRDVIEGGMGRNRQEHAS